MSDMNEQAGREMHAIQELKNAVTGMTDQGLDADAISKAVQEAYADMGIQIAVDIKVIGAYKPHVGGAPKKPKPPLA